MFSKKNAAQTAAAAADTTLGVIFGVIGSVLKVLVTVLLIILTTGLLFTCIFAFYVKTCLTADIDVSLSDFTLSESSIVLYEDSAGNWQELVTLSSSENRVWVDYGEIPQYMKDAIVSIEDQRFYEHKGVDWYRTFGAFVNMFATMKDDFGGSTITQQLIKNLTGKDEATVQRKLVEIFQALDFEKKYDKDEILEWYLNAVYFGENYYGVSAAAKGYFGKELSELSLAECASIICITNWPSKYDPFISESQNKDRQETVLRKMYELGYINYDEYINAVNEELVFVHSDNEEGDNTIYSWYVEALISDLTEDIMERKGVDSQTARQLLYNGGYRIYSSYDADIQYYVDAVYQDLTQIPSAYRSSGTQQLQSAIVIMDPYTGEIVALSGGVGEKNANLLLNRATSTTRPAGSSIKPLSVYGPALEYGLITQNTLVNDAGPDEIQLSGTSWYPTNADYTYRHYITIATALRLSINTVAAQILDKLGVSASYEYLTQILDFTTLVPDDESYAPLALGQFTNGVTVREMCQAYSSFVNDGVFTTSRTYTKVTDAAGNTIMDNPAETHVAWKANTAYNILSMLQNAVSWGTGSEAYLGNTMPVAGKTGTTSNNWDRWFVGMTPYYVAAVWTGYDNNEYMYVNGNPAAQIWKKVMQPIMEKLEYKSFPYPSIGGDTQLFGDLEEEYMIQEGLATPTPTATPAATATPAPTAPIITTPTPTEPVVAPDPSPTPTKSIWDIITG